MNNDWFILIILAGYLMNFVLAFVAASNRGFYLKDFTLLDFVAMAIPFGVVLLPVFLLVIDFFTWR